MTDSSDRYPHLLPKIQPVMDLSDDERIRYVFMDRFIPYDRAEEILDELELLYNLDNALRPQGRLLVGSSLSGKTTILREFEQRHPANDNVDGDAAYVPVLYLSIPETPKEGIYHEILGRLSAHVPRGSKSHEVRDTAIKIVKDVRTRVLIIDELNQIMEGSQSQQRLVLNSIKTIMNEVGRPVVVAGTEVSLQAVATDRQIRSRLAPMPLQPFRTENQFSLLLMGFEAVLPLKKRSNLGETAALLRLVYQMTGGHIGQVSDLLNKAARYAISNDVEQITEEVLKNCGFQLDYDLT